MLRNACDACKRRKVKCDGTQPCGTCTVSRLDCQYSKPRKRGPKPARARQALAHAPATEHIPDETARYATHITIDSGASCSQSSLVASTPDRVPSTTPSVSPWIVPHMITSPCSERVTIGSYNTSGVELIWRTLIARVKNALPSLTLLEIADECIHICMRYMFCMAPIFHEPDLREAVTYFFSNESTSPIFDAGDDPQRIDRMRSFAVLTSVCASVAAAIPKAILAYKHDILRPFLDASRHTLRLYEDYDLEYPDSTSLAIRMLQSFALQHEMGKTGLAWHILSQAALLARRMRLYDEDTIKASPPMEGQLLRRLFWHMYLSDQAAAMMKNRVVLLHESLFDGELTLKFIGETDQPMLDMNRSGYQGVSEQQLFTGYDLGRRVFCAATTLFIAMKDYIRTNGLGFQQENGAEKMRLTQHYLDFVGAMDDLPSWLEHAKQVEAGGIVDYQKMAPGIQFCSIESFFHCIHLILMQEAINGGVVEIMGLSDQKLTLMMRKLAIAHDFLQGLRMAPFVVIQIQGEPMVEKLRRVGIVLLEISENADNESIQKRSRSYLTQLLDTLSRLDSKASDELNK
ncbi:hypothetical protein BS50DRAFT_672962 [Corynespora cassiicola Philippines]|uniref:Zn(2)-C6 fungal-type domain-containing protein n=1 Tax=Corynespora cassiicola Philippines TaxID=1448308 RepID=A0A2T2P3K8_CORCC|nr:hypothetical protein BS50DRAFT_672962 [Corynespora cassiicola Philippines]